VFSTPINLSAVGDLELLDDAVKPAGQREQACC
jgi:hypothetical protein